MKIDYEVIWVEDGNLKFKQFKYEIESFPLTSFLPDDVYSFYDHLIKRKFPVIVTTGESETMGTGILRLCNADPIY